jgi:hypothetical protein
MRALPFGGALVLCSGAAAGDGKIFLAGSENFPDNPKKLANTTL